MTGVDGFAIAPDSVTEKPEVGGTGYFAASPKDFDRAHAIDVPQLFAFFRTTQPDTFKKLALTNDPKDINRLKFLSRLSYGAPSLGNTKARSSMRRTGFRLHVSLPTAWTRLVVHWTSACLSMACQSQPSS
jgi:hypothetical protein